MKTLFLGLAGKKQVGKSTFSDHISSYLLGKNIDHIITCFAEPLKRFCVDVLGLKPKTVYGSDVEKNKRTHIKWESVSDEIRAKYAQNLGMRHETMTGREVMQVFGTDIVRKMYSEAWAAYPFRAFKEDIVIINDVRFPNELEQFSKHGGKVVRIMRETGLKDSHMSETALDDFSFPYYDVIDNNGSHRDLIKKSQDLIERILNETR
jgi:hypothetical protein